MQFFMQKKVADSFHKKMHANFISCNNDSIHAKSWIECLKIANLFSFANIWVSFFWNGQPTNSFFPTKSFLAKKVYDRGDT